MGAVKVSLSMILVSICCYGASAQLTVEKIKDNRAIVNIPVGVTLKEGDLLFIEAPTTKVPQPPNEEENYESRDRRLSYSWSFSTAKTEEDPKFDSTIHHLEGIFGWNFRIYEMGLTLLYETNKSSDYDFTDSTTVYGAYGQFNFRPNTEGATIVPFARVTVGVPRRNSWVGTSYSGTYYSVGGGCEFFPFDNGVGLGVSLMYSHIELKNKGGDIDGEAPLLMPGSKSSGYKLGSSISIMF